VRDLDDKGAGVGDEDYPAAGEWVQVWGQVRKGPTHPEDVLIEFFSHSEQYACHVKTDRIVWTPGVVPDFVEKCTAMHEVTKTHMFARCTQHHDHPGDHEDIEGVKFSESQVIGYIEEK
jgi:hypothetical protein